MCARGLEEERLTSWKLVFFPEEKVLRNIIRKKEKEKKNDRKMMLLHEIWVVW